MQEQKQPCPVQGIALGERERFPYELSQPLAQRVVPPLDVRRLALSFAGRPMLCVWNHASIRLPEVRGAGRRAPRRGHMLPEITATLLAAITQTAGHHLARV